MASLASMTWKEVWTRRLARHSLLEQLPAEGRSVESRIVDVASAVCGIHAQVMPAAELSIGIRVQGVTRLDVSSALWEKRLLIKTFGLRGTVHLFPAAELSLWMAALHARSQLDVKRYEATGLDPAQLEQVLEAIGWALDGRRLTLPELGEYIEQRAGRWAGEMTSPAWGGAWPRWRKALGDGALAGLLCYGPPQGNQVTFVRPDQWAGEHAPKWQHADPQQALVEVFRRYLRAYGPATTRDFAQWFNIPPRPARDLAANIKDELEEVDVEGYRSYLLAEDGASTAHTAGGVAQLPVRLLPHFDCYVIGCHPRGELLPADWGHRVPPRTTPSQLPTLLVEGKVAGVWQRIEGKAKGRQIEVRVEPFMSLDKRQRGLLEEEAAKIGAILGVEAALVIGPVAIRPHL